MTETKLISAAQPEALILAMACLQAGGTLAFPTDTVYGLAANAYNPAAIEKLYTIKGRDETKAIAVLIGSLTQLDQVAAYLNDSAQKLAQAFWPGALTLVVARHPSLPDILSPRPTIGVRIPDHPLARQILTAAGPLAVTSANLSGQPDCGAAQDVAAQLDGRVDLILDGGRTPGGQPSTVVDVTGEGWVMLREGPVSGAMIEQALA